MEFKNFQRNVFKEFTSFIDSVDLGNDFIKGLEKILGE